MFYQNERRIRGQMIILAILTTIALYWGLFAEPTVVLVFAIPTILCELMAYLSIKERKNMNE